MDHQEPDRQTQLNTLMLNIPEPVRYRWCSAGGQACACMGAANCSGGLRASGFTKEDWEAWVANHPDARYMPPQDHVIRGVLTDLLARS